MFGDNSDEYEVDFEYNDEMTLEDIIFDIIINCYELPDNSAGLPD